MRIVAQIARNGTLSVNNEVISQLSYGLLLLVSFKNGDSVSDVAHLAEKIIKMRIFPDKDGKTNLNIIDAGGSILSVSQFTLYGEFKGRRPSFTNVLPSAESSELFAEFNRLLAASVHVETGVFGAHMDISFTNVGPATYIVEDYD